MAKITKDEVRVFTRKLHRHVRRHKDSIEFKKIHGATGLYYEDGIIEIDYRKDIIPTLVHEFLHHIHKDWKEKQVWREERRIMKGISKRQVTNLLKSIIELIAL